MKKSVLLLSLGLSILLSNTCKGQNSKWKIIGQIKNQKDTVLFAASVFISNSGMISGLRYWKKNNPGGQGLLIYGGEREDKLEEGIHTVNWKKVSDV